MSKDLPKLARSNYDAVDGMLRRTIEPKWDDVHIADVTAGAVQDWTEGLKRLDGLPYSGMYKGAVRRIMHLLVNRAMFHGLMPLGFNPISLVRIKGSTIRQRSKVLLTVDQVNRLIAALPQSVDLMVLCAASLGLRCEEVLPLQWADFDFIARTVRVQRAFTHGELRECKTSARSATLPLEGSLYSALLTQKERSSSKWLFPSPVHGSPGAVVLNSMSFNGSQRVRAGARLHTLLEVYTSCITTNASM